MERPALYDWPDLQAAILALHAHVCRYCGGRASGVDHVIPRCDGGSDGAYNLTACCHSCNTRKNRFRLDPELEAHILDEASMLAPLAVEIAHVSRRARIFGGWRRAEVKRDRKAVRLMRPPPLDLHLVRTNRFGFHAPTIFTSD